MNTMTQTKHEANVQLIKCSQLMQNGIEIDSVQLLSEQIGNDASELFQCAVAEYFVLPTITTLYNNSCVTYGIGVLQNGIMSSCIPDISDDFNTVKSLVLRCNEYQLEPEHLMDVIEDALN